MSPSLPTSGSDTTFDSLHFGAILLRDVVEHIEDAGTFLRDLLRAFPNARHVLIAVPARMELWSNYDESTVILCDTAGAHCCYLLTKRD
jgi:hypothetical protein